MAILFLLVLLLIVLLWKCHSREGGKALKPLSLQNTVFEVNEPVDETTSDTIVSQTYYTETHSQHNETHGNENYIEIHTGHNTTHGNESYEMVAIAVPTDTHLETHANEAYQITATAISTQPHAAYGSRMDNEDDYEKIAAYNGRVDDQDDYIRRVC